MLLMILIGKFAFMLQKMKRASSLVGRVKEIKKDVKSKISQHRERLRSRSDQHVSESRYNCAGYIYRGRYLSDKHVTESHLKCVV